MTNKATTFCVLIILSLLFTLESTAQNKLVFKDKNLHDVVGTLTNLSETNPTEFFQKIDSISNTVSKEDKPLFEVIENYLKGCAYRNIRDFENLTYYFEKTKALAKQNNYRQYIAEVYREMGDEYIDSNDFEKAKKSYTAASKIYKEFNNEKGVISCIYDGFIESLQGKYKASNAILKKLLPVFKKSHPAYLDALSTLAHNYLELNIVDSAYVYVNKMPLNEIDDINNFNYQQHKNIVYVFYHLDKNNLEKATFYNEKIGAIKNDLGDHELEILYYQNKIDIASKANNKKEQVMYQDSLRLAYNNKITSLEKAKVYNTDNFINLEQKATSEKKKFYTTKIYFFTLIISLLTLIFFLLKRYFGLKKKNENTIREMKLELTDYIKNSDKQDKTKNLETTIDTTILNICTQHNLTEREADVLLQITNGLTNKEIANELFISINTVKYHTKNLYEKLDVKKRAEIASKILTSEN